MSHYAHNRQRLLAKLPNTLVVMAGYGRMQLTHDMSAPFVQEANFLYLTGIHDPNWAMVIDAASRRTYLVAPEKNEYLEQFHGLTDHEVLRQQAGADDVITVDDMKQMITQYSGTIYSLLPEDYDYFYINPAQSNMYHACKQEHNVEDIRLILARLRAVKQDYELDAIRAAVSVTTEAFGYVRERLEQYPHEAAIEGEFTRLFRTSYAHHAYQPIIASGSHACTLHYDHNDTVIEAGSFVLLDVGARVSDYCADITRTYAVGSLTERQKNVHLAVQLAQREIIALIHPGTTLAAYLQQADDIMRRTIIELGLVSNRDPDTAHHRYMPHAISHGLGLDVHDSLGAPNCFEPGMVLTVEPGIYIPDESIGVRIEDDILVTTTGFDSLSGLLSTNY